MRRNAVGHKHHFPRLAFGADPGKTALRRHPIIACPDVHPPAPSSGARAHGRTDSSNSSLTGTVSTNVVAPDVATHFGLMLPSSVPTGSAGDSWHVALDAKNNPVPNYTGTVNLSTSDTSARCRPRASRSSPPPPVTFTVTFATTGSQTSRRPTAATRRSLAQRRRPLPRRSGDAGRSHAFRAAVAAQCPERFAGDGGHRGLGANYNPVPTYTGTVNLSTSDSKATLSAASITFQANAPNTFTVTFATSGSESVTATDSKTSSLTGTANTTVGCGQRSDALRVYVAANVSFGPPTTVGLVALNAQNQVVQNYSGTVVIATSDNLATLPKGP